MADLNVITICGSLRERSLNGALAKQLPKFAPAGMTITAAPSFAEIPIYNFDIQEKGFPEAATAWADAVRKADGVVIVSPEYNYSLPAGLKNAIDWASRMKEQPFAGKAVAIQSCATGPMGGSRMQYHLRHVLLPLDAVILGKPEVIVSMAATKFDAESLELKDQPTIDFVKQQLANFEKLIRKTTGK